MQLSIPILASAVAPKDRLFLNSTSQTQTALGRGSFPQKGENADRATTIDYEDQVPVFWELPRKTAGTYGCSLFFGAVA